MSDVVWEEPPPKERGIHTSKWLPTAAEIRTRPGEWCRLPQVFLSQRHVGALKTSPAFQPRDEWEITSRKQADGTCFIYVRYVGAQEPES